MEFYKVFCHKNQKERDEFSPPWYTHDKHISIREVFIQLEATGENESSFQRVGLTMKVQSPGSPYRRRDNRFACGRSFKTFVRKKRSY